MGQVGDEWYSSKRETSKIAVHLQACDIMNSMVGCRGAVA